MKKPTKNHVARYKINLFLFKYMEDLSPSESNSLYKGLLKYHDKYPKFRMSAKVYKKL